MTTLYLDRKGCTLRVRDNAVLVKLPGDEKTRSIPVKLLTRIVIRAETEISSNAICSLADSGVSLLIIGGKFASKTAHIAGSFHNDARRRWNQAISIAKPEFCMGLASSLIRSKIRRQLRTIEAIATTRSDLRKQMYDATQCISRILDTLNNEAIAATSPARLRGMEGAAAAAYFSAYFSAFAPALGATTRNRRPARDPVNAVMSLAYTLLCAKATTACQIAGLDPALGVYHTLAHNRPALSCDLMEPYRPGIDLWIWNLFRSETLRVEHFSHDQSGACLLGKAGRTHFYSEWEKVSKATERSLIFVARRVAKSFESAVKPDAWSHIGQGTSEAEIW